MSIDSTMRIGTGRRIARGGSLARRTPTVGSGRLSPPGMIAGLLALYGCWGSSIPAMKLMVSSAPPLAGAGLVFLAGGVVLMIAARAAPKPSAAEARRAASVGLLLLVGGQGLGTVVLTKLTASLTAVLVASIPLWMALIARLHGHRRGRGGTVRLMVGFGGVMIVLVTAPAAALGGSPAAMAGCVLAAVCWAAGSVRASDTRAMPSDTRVATAIQLVSGGLVLLGIAAISGQLAPGALGRVSAESLGAAGFLLFVDSLAGFALYAHLLRTGPLGTVSSYAYVTPLVAAAIGIAVLGEHPWPGMAAGAALIVASVYREVRSVTRPVDT